jgi:hypothetical protein
MARQNFWPSGQPILYREVTQGRVWTARPVIVVCDTPEWVALCLQPGTVWRRCAPRESALPLVRCKAGLNHWRLDEVVWDLGQTLFVIHRAEAHATHLMWNRQGEFTGWYVNLQEPLRRTRLGFDFLDQELDIVVQSNGQWHWKDAEHLDQAAALGLFSPAQTRAIRQEGQRVIERIEARLPPFDATWVHWRPPADWPVARLPAGWDLVL